MTSKILLSQVKLSIPKIEKKLLKKKTCFLIK